MSGAPKTVPPEPDPDPRTAAYEAYVAELSEAWKKPPTPASDSLTEEDAESALCRAVLIFNESRDIKPLAALVAARPTPENRRALASLRKLLGTRPRRGRPRGTLNRWKDPLQRAAWLIDGKLHAWRAANNRKRVKAEVRAEIVEAVIAFVEAGVGNPRVRGRLKGLYKKGDKKRRI
jgi:hypothetical protein